MGWLRRGVEVPPEVGMLGAFVRRAMPAESRGADYANEGARAIGVSFVGFS